jgi:hypothetical protein
MAIGKSYQASPKEFELIKEFVHRYQIFNIEQKMQVIRDTPSYPYKTYPYDEVMDYHFTETHMPCYKMEVSERALVQIVNKLDEFESMMNDPETAKMLHEARFIYRLKHGTTF